jgi:hypothetical protein
LVSSLRNSFLSFLKKREKKWQDKVTFWENRMRDISKEEKTKKRSCGRKR